MSRSRAAPPGPKPPDRPDRLPRWREAVLDPFLVFLRLGLTSFGGPIAHLGLLAALYQPIWTSAIDSAKSLALALALFAGLQVWRLAPWVLVLAGAAAGTLFL
jgi:chromate transport protein ChrA